MALASDTIKILLSRGVNITLSENSKYSGDYVEIFADLAIEHNCHLRFMQQTSPAHTDDFSLKRRLEYYYYCLGGIVNTVCKGIAMLSKYAMNTYDGCQSARVEVLREVSSVKRLPVVTLPNDISFWYALNRDTIIFVSAYPRKIETKDREVEFVREAVRIIGEESGVDYTQYHILYMDDYGCVDSVHLTKDGFTIKPGNQRDWVLFSHMLNSFKQS